MTTEKRRIPTLHDGWEPFSPKVQFVPFRSSISAMKLQSPNALAGKEKHKGFWGKWISWLWRFPLYSLLLFFGWCIFSEEDKKNYKMTFLPGVSKSGFKARNLDRKKKPFKHYFNKKPFEAKVQVLVQLHHNMQYAICTRHFSDCNDLQLLPLSSLFKIRLWFIKAGNQGCGLDDLCGCNKLKDTL